MRLSRVLVPTAFAALLAACGGPHVTTISIDASPQSVNVGAGAFTTLTVTGKTDNTAIQEGSEITFETDNGSFDKSDETQSATATVAGQKAVVKLYAPAHPAVATVKAKFVDAYSNLVSATVTVTFKTSSLATKLNFSCTSRNIGAFWDGIGDIGVKCTAVAEDDNNERVQGAHVKFLSEAGDFSPTDDPEVFIYDPHAGGRLPKDVDPLGDASTGEPRWVDPSKTTGGGPTSPRNPRDGLVTLVAYVEGDSQGLFSTPYVDANDNDKYDPGEDMMPGVDTYQDSQDAVIWKQIKILWTGRTKDIPTGTHYTLTDTTPLARGASRTITWTVLDENLNIVAANDESDNITFNTDGDGTFSADALALNHSMGMDIDENFKIHNPTKAASYGRDATYSVTVTNNRAQDDTDGPKTEGIGASITHNLATDDSGVATESSDETLPGASLTFN